MVSYEEWEGRTQSRSWMKELSNVGFKLLLEENTDKAY